MEKRITLTVPIKKEVTTIDNNREEVTKKISYTLQFIDSTRFTPNSNLVHNLSEVIHKRKCKYGHNDKKCETCGLTYEVCYCFLEYTNFKVDRRQMFML